MGLSVIDAGVLIGFLDGNDPHHGAAVKVLRETLGRHDRIALPASALAETLVAPSRAGHQAVDTVLDLIARFPIEITPLGDSIAVAAAALRARHPSVKLPDALVIATAISLNADHLVTTDRKWPSGSKLGLSAKTTRI